ncbi:uncharacterized protein HMPREF1541_10212 [Cyphellophora europaea CBS 101466]|uniref:Uncharacterized protein n=1 Tax=Cyphellophora europaea (strain CBS 101466) TaxID=1220924 RepID=W2S779_CYPE1|nr:uncharacterized protein HMPREF1541_10212 [Cyphellophora europaea CBS 101466]ETN44542.1 hypothetical protein HMPREF1541_10212 [Cyphellophora europaea CBS 101466]
MRAICPSLILLCAATATAAQRQEHQDSTLGGINEEDNNVFAEHYGLGADSGYEYEGFVPEQGTGEAYAGEEGQRYEDGSGSGAVDISSANSFGVRSEGVGDGRVVEGGEQDQDGQEAEDEDDVEGKGDAGAYGMPPKRFFVRSFHPDRGEMPFGGEELDGMLGNLGSVEELEDDGDDLADGSGEVLPVIQFERRQSADEVFEEHYINDDEADGHVDEEEDMDEEEEHLDDEDVDDENV